MFIYYLSKKGVLAKTSKFTQGEFQLKTLIKKDLDGAEVSWE